MAKILWSFGHFKCNKVKANRYIFRESNSTIFIFGVDLKEFAIQVKRKSFFQSRPHHFLACFFVQGSKQLVTKVVSPGKNACQILLHTHTPMEV